MVEKLTLELDIDSAKLESKLARAMQGGSGNNGNSGGVGLGKIAGGVALGGIVKDALKSLGGVLVDSSPLLKGTLKLLQSVMQVVLMPFGDLIANKLTPFLGWFLKNREKFSSSIDGILEQFKQGKFFEIIFQGLGTMFGAGLGLIVGSLENLGATIIRGLDFAKVTDLGKMSDEEFGQLKAGNIAREVEGFSSVLGEGGRAVGEMLDDLVKFGAEATGISGVVDTIVKKVSGDDDSLKSGFEEAGTAGTNGVKNMNIELDDSIRKANNLKSIIQGFSFNVNPSGMSFANDGVQTFRDLLSMDDTSSGFTILSPNTSVTPYVHGRR